MPHKSHINALCVRKRCYNVILMRSSPPQADFFKDLKAQHVFFVKEIEHLGGSNPEIFPPAAGILPQIYPLYHFKNLKNLLYH